MGRKCLVAKVQVRIFAEKSVKPPNFNFSCVKLNICTKMTPSNGNKRYGLGFWICFIVIQLFTIMMTYVCCGTEKESTEIQVIETQRNDKL